MVRAGLIAVLFMVLATPVSAQVRACTEMGCTNGLNFTADPSFDWKRGKYDIWLALDLKTVKCRGKLPLNPCDEGHTFWCDDPSVTIIESGCALPEDAHSVGGIMVGDEPKKVILRIARNNQVMITRTIVPQYVTSMPNGPGCGPICRSASYNLTAGGSSE